MSFIWAEMSYLSMWWNEADSKSKQLLRSLVESGRLEIVTGGWVMTDEATTHYYAVLDQMIEGHEWIRVNVRPTFAKPQTGWAIDPFGLSPTMAFILKRMGLKQMVIQRAHYAIKKQFASNKQLEFYWRQQFDHGDGTDMLCHMMPFYFYDIPHTCGPDPAICCQFDFRRLQSLAQEPRMSCPWGTQPHAITSDNVHERAATIIDQYKKKAELYKSNVLLVPLGDDFRWTSESEWDAQMNNYETVMKYVNKRPEQFGAALQWGTLSDYFRLLRFDTDSAVNYFPTLSGDFFTYSDRSDHYWSGYYTSRPFYKHLTRKVESRLRAAELMFSWLMTRTYDGDKTHSFRPLLNTLFTELVLARRRLGLFQHHDGITGTARTAVVNDYGVRLTKAMNNCNRIISTSLAVTILAPGFSNGTIDALKRSPRHRTITVEMVQLINLHLHETPILTSEILAEQGQPLTKAVLSLRAPRQKMNGKLSEMMHNDNADLVRRRIIIFNSLASERVELVSVYS